MNTRTTLIAAAFATVFASSGALAQETVPALRKQLETVQAKILLRAKDPARRIEAASLLAGKGSPEVRALLMERMQPEEETDPAVMAALTWRA